MAEGKLNLTTKKGHGMIRGLLECLPSVVCFEDYIR